MSTANLFHYSPTTQVPATRGAIELEWHLNYLNLLIAYNALELRGLRRGRPGSHFRSLWAVRAWRGDSHLEAVSHNMPEGGFSPLLCQTRL
jgi:hypothetical protein